MPKYINNSKIKIKLQYYNNKIYNTIFYFILTINIYI